MTAAPDGSALRAPQSTPGAYRARRLLALAVLSLAVAAVRLPLIADPIDVRPDGGEYLSIARHLAWEGRWESDIRWHFTEEGVRHNALADRPPLYPLLAAGAVRCSRAPIGHVYAARLQNAALAGLGTVLAWVLLATQFGPPTAWLSVLLFSLLPQNLRYGSQPLSEMLFLLLMAAALLAWRRTLAVERPTGPAMLSGLLLGLTYLTHAAGAILLVGLMAASLPPYAREEGGGRRALWLAAGFVAAAVPYWTALALEFGSPFRTVLGLNFSVAHIHDAIYGGFERPLPHPAHFIAQQPALVANLIARQAVTVFGALVEAVLYLLPLALLSRRGDFAGIRGQFLLLALLLAAGHALVWVTWGAARYMLPAVLLVIPVLLAIPAVRRRELSEGRAAPAPALVTAAALLLVAIAALQIGAELARGGAGGSSTPATARWLWLGPPALLALAVGIGGRWADTHARLGWLLAASLLISVASEGRLTLRLYQEKAHPDRGFTDTPLKRAAIRWVNKNTAPDALIATDEPWLINLLTWRPTVTLPWLRDAAQARRFLAAYRPRYAILLVSDPPRDPRRERALQERLFGPAPRVGPATAWLPQRWRILVADPGPLPGQLLLILGEEESPGATRGKPRADDHATAPVVPAGHRALSGHGPAASRVRGALQADDRGVPGGGPALRSLPDPDRPGGGGAGGAVRGRHRS